jgi:hypothetical protein
VAVLAARGGVRGFTRGDVHWRVDLVMWFIHLGHLPVPLHSLRCRNTRLDATRWLNVVNQSGHEVARARSGHVSAT